MIRRRSARGEGFFETHGIAWRRQLSDRACPERSRRECPTHTGNYTTTHGNDKGPGASVIRKGNKPDFVAGRGSCILYGDTIKSTTSVS
jgi:hypothetical protein